MTIAVRQFIPQYRLWRSGKCSIFRGRLIAAPTVYDDTFTELPAKSEFESAKHIRGVDRLTDMSVSLWIKSPDWPKGRSGDL